MKQDIVLISHWTDHIASICNILQCFNVQILHFEHIQDAKQNLMNKNPAFLLLDVDMEETMAFLMEITERILKPPPYIIAAGTFLHAKEHAAILNIGADICIGKPIYAEEVLAIVRAVYRRESRFSQLRWAKPLPYIEHKELMIDPNRRTVIMRGEQVALTAKEFDILFFLADHTGRVLTQKEIFEAIWKETYHETSTGVTDHISSIRRKLKLHKRDKNYIETVFGIGYRFSETNEKICY